MWGTDTGGFVPTKELTGELYVRWFQFSCLLPALPVARADLEASAPLGLEHRRSRPERDPDLRRRGQPGPDELHNADVEPICRKYLELRYRLLPYLYSAVHEAHATGLPIMRALWLHYPDDPAAVARGDEYLWGRDILVAPVTEKGATSRKVYLPRGTWYDFWTEESLEGGARDRPDCRPVDAPPLRPGRGDPPDGPGPAVHRRENRRPA